MKQTLTSPLHVAEINGQMVRFFRTPLNDGLPDFPWHSTNDLMAALNMDRKMRREFLQTLREGPGAVVKSIATKDGVVQVCPHFMAQGLADAMVHVGNAPTVSRDQYDAAVFAAAQELEKVDNRAGSFEYTIAAFQRWSEKGRLPTSPEARS